MTSNETGFVESAQRLLAPDRSWNQQELLSAAQRAVLHNTGWPIGLVLSKPALAPKVTPDGIEARLRSQDRSTGGGKDFWSFRKDGSYYVYRAFEEDFAKTSVPSGVERFIWFDVRIWRIAELLLHSAALYRELGISPQAPYLISINHRGLQERMFWASTSRHIYEERYCQFPEVEWTKEITQDYVLANVQELVREVANDVFVLFDFAAIDEDIVKEVVEEFRRRGS
jgi:hypothetical protein